MIFQPLISASLLRREAIQMLTMRTLQRKRLKASLIVEILVNGFPRFPIVVEISPQLLL